MRTVYSGKRTVLALALTMCVTFMFLSSSAWSAVPAPPDKTAKPALPRMLDLGRNQCTPCKMMKPILEELKKQYAGVIDVEFINIADNPEVMTKLGLPVRAIPFQIFYDASGKIVKNHYGFMSKEEILQAFKDLGFIQTKLKPGTK